MSIVRVWGTVLALLFTSAAQAELEPLRPHPDALSWPTNAWPEAVIDDDRTESELGALMDQMFSSNAENLGITRAVVVIHEGQLVAERYGDGFGPTTKQVSWSVAKSITHAAIGRAVFLGDIDSIDSPSPSPWPANDTRASISWRHWLNMTDGLAYREAGADGELLTNDVVQMMFGEGRFDVIGYVRRLPQINDAGSVWNYSSAGFHTLAWALAETLRTNCAEALGAENCPPATAQINTFMHTELFDRLGMRATIEFDPAGTFLGGSLVWASARDFARFGYLYLRDGMWEGERLLPEGWVDFARTKTPAPNANEYGAGWWITPPSGRGTGNEAASDIGPRDSFSAQGHEGQLVWIVPSRDLVIVRLGVMQNTEAGWTELLDWCQRVAMAFPAVSRTPP